MQTVSETMRSVLPPVLEATWQAALLAAAVAAVCWIGRRHISPGWRFALWGLVFARLALPVIPGSPSSAFNLLPESDRLMARFDPDAATPGALTGPSDVPRSHDSRINVPPANSAEFLPRPATVDTYVATDALSDLPLTPGASTRSASRQPTDWWTIAAAVWLCGVVLLLGRQSIQRRRLRNLTASWSTVQDPGLLSLVDQCRRELKVRRHVVVMTTDEHIGPALSGLWKPVIVIPRRLTEELSREQLRLVLLHEFCHVRRCDVLWDRLANVLAAAHWFNPAAWWARSQLRLHREQACDALVLRSADRTCQREYGRLVVDLASRRASTRWETVLVGASGGPRRLKSRIDMIARYRGWNWRASLLGGLLLVVGVACGLTRAESDQEAGTESSTVEAVTANESGLTVALRDDDPAEPETYRIAGACLDENQSPLADVRVRVFQVDSRAIRRKLVAEMETDAAGEFDFPDLPKPLAGPQGYYSTYYVLAASRPGRASYLNAFFSAAESTAGLTLVMAPSGTLSGRVTDPAGNPIVGADVFITSYPSNLPIEGLFSSTTDADGRYELSDLQRWNVDEIEPVEVGDGVFEQLSGCFYTVQHPDYAAVRPMNTAVPSTIDVTLQPAATIEGQVTDEVTHEPAAGAIVSLQNAHDPDEWNHGGAWQQVTADEEGRYRLTSLSAGKYNIWAHADNRTCIALDSLSVAAGETMTDADIALIEGGWIEGRVLDAESGDPLTHAPNGLALQIGLHGPARPKSGAAVESTPVEDDGRFRIQAPPGRNFPYIMMHELWQRVEARSRLEEGVEVRDGEVVSLEFRILERVPRPTPTVAPVRQPVPVPEEREAAQAVRDLGGWYQVDDDRHVIEVNMVYHVTEDDVRFDNPVAETDEVLQWLPSFPRLKRLFLKEGQATNDGLAHVSGLTELEVFFIWDAHAISDAGIEHLRGLEKLANIHVDESQISDDSLAVFGTLPSLEQLSLQGNDFSDDGVRHLSGLTRLKSLWIGRNETPYSDDIAWHLAEMTSLQELDLEECTLTDAGLRQLAPLTQLRSLYIGGPEPGADDAISDASLSVLLGMRELRNISINNTRLGDDALQQIADLPHLESIILTVGVISREAVESIREQHPDLKLYVGGL